MKFADVGEGITEGRVVKWLVNDGEEVKEDQPIVQVETDKAVVSLPAPTSGKIRRVAKEGQDIRVGDLLAVIGEDQGGTQGPVNGGRNDRAGQLQVARVRSETGSPQVIATPRVRRLARELGVDISKVRGTGPGGKVTEEDVKSAVSAKDAGGIQALQRREQRGEEDETTGPLQGTTITPAPQRLEPPVTVSKGVQGKIRGEVEAKVETLYPPQPPDPEGTTARISLLRMSIAKNMEKSNQIPRAVHMDLREVDVFWEFYQSLRAELQEMKGVKLTLTPLLVKALALALKENPQFNARYDFERGEVIYFPYVNMGVAMEAEDGLRVVVVKDADSKSLLQINQEISTLKKKVMDKTITLEEMRGSTFSLSNPGPLGSGFLSVPMINTPNVGILATGPIRDMPWVRDGKVVPVKVLPYSISFDHRAVDGADAVKLGESFIKYLNHPRVLVVS